MKKETINMMMIFIIFFIMMYIVAMYFVKSLSKEEYDKIISKIDENSEDITRLEEDIEKLYNYHIDDNEEDIDIDEHYKKRSELLNELGKIRGAYYLAYPINNKYHQIISKVYGISHAYSEHEFDENNFCIVCHMEKDNYIGEIEDPLIYKEDDLYEDNINKEE